MSLSMRFPHRAASVIAVAALLTVGLTARSLAQPAPTGAAPTGAAAPAANPVVAAPGSGASDVAGQNWVNTQLGREPPAYKLPGKAGERPAPGDFWRTQGYFGLWTLTCDIVLSKNVKVCRIGQDASLPNGLGSLHADVAIATDEKAYLFIFAPPWADRLAGMTIMVDGAQLPIPLDLCNIEHCRASAPFSGMLQKAMLGQGSVLVTLKKSGVEVGSAIITEQLNVAAKMSASPKILTGVSPERPAAKKPAAKK